VSKIEPVPLGPHKQKVGPPPEEMYKKTMTAIGNLWRLLGNYKDIPGPNTDIQLKIIEPSRDFRLRFFKGIESLDRKVLVIQFGQIDLLLRDSVRMIMDIQREQDKTKLEK
jgi:hypothetical protein